MSLVYSACIADGAGNESLVLQCVASSLEEASSTNTENLQSLSAGVDIFFLIFSASLMFLMQAGFAMLCAGCVRKKNVQNTLLKNLLDACGAALAFWSVGYAFAYGGQTATGEPSTFVGDEYFFLIGTEDYAFWLFQYAFAATTSTIVAGTLAERCQMIAYLLFSIFLTAFVYPIIVHAIWNKNGFLSPFKVNPIAGTGMIDFAGSGVVHVTGGLSAIIATKILGPRQGRFHDEKGSSLATPSKIEGHSSSLQCLGTFVLWFGWYGFNAGSIFEVSSKSLATIAANATVSTTLGAAMGCVSALGASAFLARRRTGETSWELSDALNGCLAGLVGITGGCGVFEPWAAFLVGGVSGLIYLYGSNLLVKRRIDDAVDAIPVHLFCGTWGVIAVGLFASPRRMLQVYGRDDHVGWVYSWGRGSADATLLGINVVGLCFIGGWVFFTMTPLFLFLSYMGWFRADSLEEIIGLDPSSSDQVHTSVVTSEHRLVLKQRLQMRSGANDLGEDTFESDA